jgi:hypothetical protein
VTCVTNIALIRVSYATDRVHPGNGFSSWGRGRDEYVFVRIEVDYSIIIDADLIGLDSLLQMDAVERAHDILAIQARSVRISQRIE